MSVPVDESTIRSQRRAADPARSAWVSANAGAGKTRVLTERVARLLLAGVEPGRILCLTFTKAAAAEMMNRLFLTLSDWSILPRERLVEALHALTGTRPEDEQLNRARILFATTLDAPGGLRIQTIHSFCQDLLGRFPLEAGVIPGFEVQDERTAAELLHGARDTVFRRMMENDDASTNLRKRLTRQFSESSLMDFLEEITSKRGGISDALNRDGLTKLLSGIRSRLGVEKDTTPDTLIAAAFHDDAFACGQLRRAAQILARGSKTEQQTADAIHGLLSAEDRQSHYETYRSAFFTKDGRPRARLLNKGTRDAHPELAAVLEEEQARLTELDDACRCARLAALTEVAFTFAKLWLDAYEILKQERGTLDYEDLILKARELLTDAPSAAWVLFKLDQSVDHVLVDEAQDTSPEQWDVITRLTEDFFAGRGAESARNRTVFAVGDEKQSIYGFQGAAPELFQETARRLGTQAENARIPWSTEVLDLSFRSLPAILEAVDYVFARPGTADGLTFNGAAVSHRPWRRDGRGLVEIWPVIKPESEDERPAWDAPLDRPPPNDPRSQLAARIAGAVQTWLKTGESVYSGETVQPLRPMRPGDILILVRRRDRLVDEMIRAFRERNIPVAGTDRLSLIDHIAVMDLMVAADTALLPDDDLTVATLLKSPLGGLDDDALFELAHGRRNSLIEVLRQAAENSRAFARAWKIIDWLISHRDLRPFDFFSRLLSVEAGRARLLARLGPDAADPMEEFLNRALAFERTHTPTLQGFLHQLRTEPVDVKRDMDQRADEIRIMTVHGAKGLQSDVVILPDTCTVPTARNDPAILPLPKGDSAGPGFVMAPTKAEDCTVSAEARAAYAAKRDAEFRRLLYVALTRARDRLYICGYESAGRDRPGSCWYNLVRDAISPHAVEAPGSFGETVLRLGEVPPLLAPQAAAGDPKPVSIPPWAEHPPHTAGTGHRRVSPSALAVRETESVYGTSRTDSAVDAARRGNLIHKLLELLPGILPEEREPAARRFLDACAADLTEAERARLAAETLQVLIDAASAAIFGPASIAEVPVMGAVPELGENFIVDGRIDRLLVTDTQILAVDFKTGAVPAAVDEVPADYLTQMAAYRALLRRIYPGRAVNCALLWTRKPVFMDLPVPRMNRALREVAAGFRPP